MSLVAWYPLHKDMNDWSGNGLHGTSLSAYPQINTGIIGKTYNATTKGQGISLPDADRFKLCDYTFAAWVRPNGNHLAYTGAIMSSGNWNASEWVFGVAQGNSGVCFPGLGYSTYYGNALTIGGWNHIVVTRKGGLYTLYQNGVQTAQVTGTDAMLVSDAANTTISRETYASGYFNFYGSINDLRVYSHAISVKEIRELSRARYLHYTFENNFYGSLKNVAPQWWVPYAPYSTLISQSLDHWEVSDLRSGNSTIAVQHSLSYPAGARVRISGYMTVNGNPVAITNATTYATTESWENDPATGWFSIVEVFDSMSVWLFHAGYNSTVIGDVVRCEGITIEDLSYDNGRGNSVSDASGLGYDSQPLTNLAPGHSLVDTGKGKGAAKFTTVSQMYTSNITRDTTAMTLTGWMKLYSYPVEQSPLFEYPYLNVRYQKVGCYWHDTSNPGYHTGATTVPLNEWVMISAVWDGTTIKLYLNGELDYTASTTTPGRQISDCRMGYASANRTLDGKIGEASMYGTALSAETLKELYEVRASLDNAKTMRASAFNTYKASTHGITKEGVGNFTDIVELNFKKSLVDYSTWVIGGGSAPGWSANGEASANWIMKGINPWGVEDVMWTGRFNDTASDADGGFNGGTVTLDPTKHHRYSIWIRREVSGNGTWYFGCNGGQTENLSGTANTNPYFYSSSSTMSNQWFLLVGYLYAAGTTVEAYTDDGAYYVDGSKPISSLSSFRMKAGSTVNSLRAYLYYSTNTSTIQQFYRPRIDPMDGLEPSIADLLSSAEHVPILSAYGTGSSGESYSPNARILKDGTLVVSQIEEV